MKRPGFTEVIPDKLYRCNSCGGSHWVWPRREPPHTCPPLFLVWEDGCTEEDASRIYATDSEEAAKRWGMEDDQNGDYLIVGQRAEPLVSVRRIDSDTIQRFRVTGEAVPEYHAEDLKPS